jgi:hypothetical protein
LLELLGIEKIEIENGETVGLDSAGETSHRVHALLKA